MTPGYWVFSSRYENTGAPVSAVSLASPLLPSTAPNWNTPGENSHKALVIVEAALPATTTRFRYCLDDLGRYRQGTVCGQANMKATPYY